jgi:hypothetical protein
MIHAIMGASSCLALLFPPKRPDRERKKSAQGRGRLTQTLRGVEQRGLTQWEVDALLFPYRWRFKVLCKTVDMKPQRPEKQPVNWASDAKGGGQGSLLLATPKP